MIDCLNNQIVIRTIDPKITMKMTKIEASNKNV